MVKNVSFDIRKSETLGLVGESGSGKSTVANIISGLQPPMGGGIYFANDLLHPRGEKRPPEVLRRIQLIFSRSAFVTQPTPSRWNHPDWNDNGFLRGKPTRGN